MNQYHDLGFVSTTGTRVTRVQSAEIWGPLLSPLNTHDDVQNMKRMTTKFPSAMRTRVWVLSESIPLACVVIDDNSYSYK
jgi:hypothetical protein